MSAETTPQGWDRTADAYNEMMHNMKFSNTYGLDAIKFAIGNEPRDGLKILDVACGTGALSLEVAAYVKEKNGTVLATDFSPKMVEKMAENAKKLNLPNIEAKVMDGQALDIPDETFDYGFSIFGLIFFPRRDLGMKEFHRVLKKGGKVAICSWKEPPVMAAARETMRRLHAGQPADSSKPAVLPIALSLSNADMFKSELEAAGFNDVVVHEVSHPMVANQYEDIMKGMEVNPAMLSMKEAMGPEKATLYDSTYLQVLKDMHPTLPLSLNSVGYVGVGTK